MPVSIARNCTSGTVPSAPEMTAFSFLADINDRMSYFREPTDSYPTDRMSYFREPTDSYPT